jgi:hypothetical protein
LRARIAGWQIVDGDVETPVAGSVLEGCALRLHTTGHAGEDEVVVEGTITWARFDERNGLLESVITADRFTVLAQAPATPADPLPRLGTPVRQAGRLHSIGSYEFDAFGLPDVTQSWLVLAGEKVERDDFMVDVEPVDSACTSSSPSNPVAVR